MCVCVVHSLVLLAGARKGASFSLSLFASLCSFLSVLIALRVRADLTNIVVL